MDKETAFREIKQQQALLWAGAGLSRYAGYPMGKGTVEALYEALSDSQRQQLLQEISQNENTVLELPLPDFAQHFVDLHGNNRQKLVKVITQLFSAQPTTKATHDKLALISYIDQIVTTNYDPLFELAYGFDRLHVVTQADNVPQIGDKPITLFKIHGELARPNSLIITKDDYRRFADKADDVVWTQLRALMSTRTIIFIGYAVEDPNVLDVFLELVNRLGQLMRPAYVVGPSMTALRMQRLEKQNIFFIKSTGEEFVDGLLEYLKQTALVELPRDGLRAISPVSQLLKNMGLNFSLKIDSQKPFIDEIYPATGTASFSFNFQYDSEELHQALTELQTGKSFAPVKIETSSLINFSRTAEGFKLPNNITTFWIAKSPGLNKIVDVRFSGGLLLRNVQIAGYAGIRTFNIVALSMESRLEIVRKRSKKITASYKMHFDRRRDVFRNSEEALQCARTMQAIGNGEPVRILKDGLLIWQNDTHQIKDKNNSLKRNGDYLVSLIEALQVIENKFGVLFHNFTTKSDSSEENIMLLANILNFKDRKIEFLSKYEVNVSKTTIELYNTIKNNKLSKEMTLCVLGDYSHEVNILGWTLRISWQEQEQIMQPAFEIEAEKQNSFFVWSKNKQSVRKVLSIISTEVIYAPVPPDATPVDLVKKIEELSPRH